MSLIPTPSPASFQRSIPPIRRRTLLGAVAAVPVATALGTTTANAQGRPGKAVEFTLNARVLDGGEQVVSLTLHTAGLGPIRASGVSSATFSVHAKATSPVPLADGELIFSEYDLDREVTGVRVDQRGNITLELFHGEGITGGGTLGYLLRAGRNVELDLVYTITQNEPIRLRSGKNLTLPGFRQGVLSDPEVDRFGYGRSRGTGMNYRLYRPAGRGRGKHPLIVWLHGGGEGGVGERQTNQAQLRANRGALGFTTPQAQQIFGGAYVLAPQCVSAWMNDGALFSPQVKTMIDELLRSNKDIDPRRVHVLGCSNGGYLTLRMESDFPSFFATGVPVCPGATPNFFTDDELRRVRSTPTWFVHSKDDTTLPWEPNTGRALGLVPNAIASLYDTVTWDGYRFAGHWSWIYVAHNDPQHQGTRLWQWMAAHRR